MDQAEFFDNLHTYIANMDEDLKVDETTYEERLKVCTSCDRLEDGMCRACGCYVELRALTKGKSCPYGQW